MIMAPVPKDNQNNKPSNSKDDDEISDFSNPHQLTPIDIVGSSDDSDSDTDSTPGGYTLLPQEPTDNGDSDSDEGHHEDYHEYFNTDLQDSSAISDTVMAAATCDFDAVPDAVLLSEAGAAAPTVIASQGSLHPNFLAKYPDGKIPAYNQVPDVPKEKGNQLWNQERQNVKSVTLDAAQENQILKAMSSFSLPVENIPPWAQKLSDDQWNNQVLHQIKKSSRRDQGPPQAWVDKSAGDGPASKTWTANFDENDS